MHSYLNQIVKSKQVEVNSLKQSMMNFEHFVVKKLPNYPSNLRAPLLENTLKKSDLTVIAEIKRCSPSEGEFAVIEHPDALACRYILGGAEAISVLTEENYFHGKKDDLKIVKQSVGQYIPVLRKDFMIDPIQLVESLIMGANIVLLIAMVLKNRLGEFLEKSRLLGLEAIVEVNNEKELDLALESGASIIGINNRDLKTFEVSVDLAFNLIERFPHGVLPIAASGISHPSQARLLHQVGFAGVLIGKALVLEKNPEKFIQQCKNVHHYDGNLLESST